jgi:hypothetical protein
MTRSASTVPEIAHVLGVNCSQLDHTPVSPISKD